MTEQGTGDVAATPAVGLLDVAARATAAYDRPDLARHIERVRARVDDPSVRVLVVGEFKQGKSSLVNALVAAPVCPVDDDIATALATTVTYADAPEAHVVREPSAPGMAPTREPVALDDVAAVVSEAGDPHLRRGVLGVEIGLPRQVLRAGLVLVDTPGVGGLGSTHSAATVAALPSADAVLLVTDASQELTGPELEFLGIARDLCPTTACVVTKTDVYPAWRRIVELDRTHLDERDMTMPVLATSASLRTTAISDADRDLNDESGYPPLLAYLRERVLADTAGLTARAVAEVVADVAEQLQARFVAERAALEDPEGSAALVAELSAARARAAEQRGQAARWQQVLSDGIADLTADADHDLRGRMRKVGVRADEAIADADPGQVWDELSQWLYRQVNAQVAASYAMVTTRARALTAQVAECFAEGDEPLQAAAVVGVDVPHHRLDAVGSARTVDPDRTTIAARGLTAMRGSYGGVMMIGMHGQHVVGIGPDQPGLVGLRCGAGPQGDPRREASAPSCSGVSRGSSGVSWLHRRRQLRGRQGRPRRACDSLQRDAARHVLCAGGRGVTAQLPAEALDAAKRVRWPTDDAERARPVAATSTPSWVGCAICGPAGRRTARPPQVGYRPVTRRPGDRRRAMTLRRRVA